MNNANLAAIKQAIYALQILSDRHDAGRENPARQVDAAIVAQNAIDDLVQSDAIRKLKTDALARRKAEFLEKRGANNG